MGDWCDLMLTCYLLLVVSFILSVGCWQFPALIKVCFIDVVPGTPAVGAVPAGVQGPI